MDIFITMVTGSVSRVFGTAVLLAAAAAAVIVTLKHCTSSGRWQ